MSISKNIIIYPHNSFNLLDAEISIQYYLAKILNNLGVDVKIYNIYDNNSQNLLYNRFITLEEIEEIDVNNRMVIYTEGIIGNPLKAKYVVRWILGKTEMNIPLDYSNSWNDNEIIYFLHHKPELNSYSYIKYLPFFYIYDQINNLHNERNGTCFFKRDLINNEKICEKMGEIINENEAFELKHLFSQITYCEIFNIYEKFVNYCPCIFLNIIAALSGCISIIAPIENISKEEYYKMTFLADYMKDKNINEIYGIAYGVTDEEINYAKKTSYLLKIQVMDIQNWYINKYIKNFVNDINNWEKNNNTILFYKSIIVNNNENYYFNSDSYLEYNPDLKNLPNDYLLQHYELYGKNEGRIAAKSQIIQLIDGKIFDLDFYRKCNDDLKNYSAYELIQHYRKYGKKEGRISNKKQLTDYLNNPYFSIECYKKYNDEIKNCSSNYLIHHYKNNGKKEGKISSNKELIDLIETSYFDIENYKKEHPELTKYSTVDLINHYKKSEKFFDKQFERKKYNYLIKIEDYNKIYLNTNIEFVNDNLQSIINSIRNNDEPKQQYRSICNKQLKFIRNLILPEFNSESKYEAVLIEYRCLPHLEFLIRNAIIKLGEKWCHTIICGNLNFKYMVNMCQSISPKIKVINTDYDNLTQYEYSNFLTTHDFWDLLQGEKVLIYQEDTLIFKNNIDEFLEWDYIGAPWPDGANHNSKNVGNGGLSLRSRTVMKEIIDLFDLFHTGERYIGHKTSKLLFEDVYFTKNMVDFNIGLLADKEPASNFSTEFICNKDSFGGHTFWANDRNWRDRINTVFHYDFDYGLVFICHDLNSFMKVEKYLIHKNCYIIFVGKQDFDILHKNEKVFIANEFENNIENEKKLLTFTAWYLIVKNNLFEKFTHICLLEYDVIIEPYFFHNLNMVYKNYDVVSFKGGDYCFDFDININVLQKFIKTKNIERYNSKDFWYHSTNHCIKRELLVDFVNWYYPDYSYIKLYDYKNLSYYHERLFSVFIQYYNKKCYLLDNCINHIQKCSHGTFNKKITTENIFLTYNDNSKKFDEYTNHLLVSVKKYSNFQSIIFSKNNIDEYFKKQHGNILNETFGAGYWLWKPYIILTTLNQLKDNSILFYLDSKYYFIENFENSYSEYLVNNDILVWKNKPNEEITYLKNYCKMDVINKYEMNHVAFNKNVECCWAGAIVIKKTALSLKIISEWLEMCCDYNNITNVPSSIPNSNEFIEHRHDQSLLSIVLHKHNVNFQHFPKKYLQNIRYPW
jgi:hypothetical protein